MSMEWTGPSVERAEAVEPHVRYPHDAAVIARRPKSWAAEVPSAERRGLYDALLAAERSRGRAEGARRERERLQSVLAGVMAVAALESVIIFALVVWR